MKTSAAQIASLLQGNNVSRALQLLVLGRKALKKRKARKVVPNTEPTIASVYLQPESVQAAAKAAAAAEKAEAKATKAAAKGKQKKVSFFSFLISELTKELLALALVAAVKKWVGPLVVKKVKPEAQPPRL